MALPLDLGGLISGYEFMDYVKVGVPLTILVGIIAVVLAPIVYGFAVP